MVVNIFLLSVVAAGVLASVAAMIVDLVPAEGEKRIGRTAVSVFIGTFISTFLGLCYLLAEGVL